jgi:2-C-methyl-D-erythritol 2,4-cyclodiphosphate synthase
MFRIGIGYDIHRLVSGRKLFLGGVEIPYKKGLLGHSDGDTLIHAVSDALLGAMGMGDIGEHFPDTEARYKDIASIELLKIIAGLMEKEGFCVNNIDLVVIAQEPSLLAFKQKIKERIASVLKISEDRLGLKAKTNEGLGEIGKKKAVACYAVAILARGE